jgi:hypothetical protein
MKFWQPVAPRSNSDPWTFRRRLCRRVSVGAVLAAGALVLSSGSGVAQAATPPNKTTFHFSGAVRGTFTQSNSDCNEVGAFGGQFEFYSKLKGSSSNEWTVNVNNLGKQRNGGTFKKFGGILGNGVSIVLSGSNGKTAYYWASKSGSLTLSSTSGTVNALLVPDRSFVGKPGKGNIHLTGSWGCVDDS